MIYESDVSSSLCLTQPKSDTMSLLLMQRKINNEIQRLFSKKPVERYDDADFCKCYNNMRV